MARGNWRNWERLETPTREAHCVWCGHKWKSKVPYSAVCPKCNLEELTAKDILNHPEWQNTNYLSRKTLAMKGKFIK